MVRSGWPTSCQNRRAILVAVSMESEPPLVRNTRLSVTGARDDTRSASSDAGRFDRSPNAVAADQDQLAVSRYRCHVGERMPEMRHAGEATSGVHADRVDGTSGRGC